MCSAICEHPVASYNISISKIAETVVKKAMAVTAAMAEAAAAVVHYCCVCCVLESIPLLMFSAICHASWGKIFRF